MTDPQPSFWCPLCGATSYNPKDIEYGYCGACHDVTGRFGALWYDKQGNRICLRDVEPLLGDMDYKRVASDEIGLYWVSTVWLGLDHQMPFHLAGVGFSPLIFETMVFLGGTVVDTHMQRYSTEDQAKAGHEAICAEIREMDAAVVDVDYSKDRER